MLCDCFCPRQATPSLARMFDLMTYMGCVLRSSGHGVSCRRQGTKRKETTEKQSERKDKSPCVHVPASGCASPANYYR